MGTINVLAFLIIAFCCSACLSIETNYLFNSNQFPDSTSVPTLSNGNLGFTVFGDSVFLTGVYNGRGSQSHRARIPNYANVQLSLCSQPETNPPYCTYQLDIKFGRFRTIYEEPSGQFRLIHSVYPHRFFSHVIVNHIRVQRLIGQNELSVALRHIAVAPSFDISLQPTETVEIRNTTFMYECGQTNEVEDPVLQSAGTEVCIYYTQIPSVLHLPTDRTGEEFAFYTAFARNKRDAENDLELLTLSTVSNTDQIQARVMNDMWDQYGITVDGNDELDRAIKASAFQVFNNVPSMLPFVRTFGVSPSGIGRNDFQGHVTWDYDMWIFPIVLLIDPIVARDMLNYRSRIIRNALKSNAAKNNHEGWQFPWASAFTGREVTSSPGAVLQHHITADVVFAMRQFIYANNQLTWILIDGCELIYETAQFWKHRAVYNNATDKFDIRSVTGPDTLNPNVNNNAFTNVVAAHNLFLGEYAGCLCQWSLNVKDEDLVNMIRTARGLDLLHDFNGDFIPQFEGYTVGQRISQADAILLSYPLDISISNSTKRRNLEIYGAATADDTSPMTWAMHTIGWIELDEMDLAAEYLRRSYQPYIRSPFHVWNQGSTENPGSQNFVFGAASFLHTMINGYAGIRLRSDEMVLDRPRLPPGTTRLYIPTINYNRFRFSLEIRQNGGFSIMQQATPTLPNLLIIVDGVEHNPCGLNTACFFNGSQSATLKVLPSTTERCQLKPTRLNMTLAEQNSGITTRQSPVVIASIVILTALSTFLR
ncbi:protein-glucosylgalactosylhydroxylysine glucosidase-like [Armigeres subalbatus]|uniref:protein-glucosylgalactosylhydroxylysine glucosidase-like n=1 Tax=Armigeres subalbatus TaxID=124917 RepID=UPI002ED0434B